MTITKTLLFPSLTPADDDWYKVAILYWDQIGRVAPSTYSGHLDGPIGKAVADEGLVFNLPPSGYYDSVLKELPRFLATYGQALSKKYSVQRRGGCIVDPLNRPVDVLDIYYDKMPMALVEGLEEYKLAVTDFDHIGGFMRLDRRVAVTYLSALAERIATSERLSLSTDNAEAACAVGSLNLDRIAATLLGASRRGPPGHAIAPNNVNERLAALAITLITPAGLCRCAGGRPPRFQSWWPHRCITGSQSRLWCGTRLGFGRVRFAEKRIPRGTAC